MVRRKGPRSTLAVEVTVANIDFLRQVGAALIGKPKVEVKPKSDVGDRRGGKACASTDLDTELDGDDTEDVEVRCQGSLDD